MSWLDSHSKSEKLARLAEQEARQNKLSDAIQLYCNAASWEEEALNFLDGSKSRTIGITAVSAVSLWFKGQQFQKAKVLAYKYLGTGSLPYFAVDQLEELLQIIQIEESIKRSGVEFTKQILVSVSGGQVVKGGAPLDLINKKVDEVGKLFYRTIEMLLKKPLRKSGAPSQEVQEQCRPWLFQAPAGSYQFAVRIQKPAQLSFFPEDIPDVEVITQTFFDIIKAGTQDITGSKLAEVVPDRGYQNVFLKLTQSLAPSEKDKTFSRVEIKVPTLETDFNNKSSVVLLPESREIVKEVLKRSKDNELTNSANYNFLRLKGILRGLQLDNDWIDVKTTEGDERIIHITSTGDAVDDVVGPMVNRKVIVEVSEKDGKYFFHDIQVDE